MLKHLAALVIVLAFVGQTLAGAALCGKDKHDGPAEMACCAQAKSAAGSPAMVICCQTVCGEPTSGTTGTQPETTVRPHVQAAPVALHPVVTFDQLLASAVRVSTRPADALLLKRDPPALYLHNSAFLI